MSAVINMQPPINILSLIQQEYEILELGGKFGLIRPSDLLWQPGMGAAPGLNFDTSRLCSHAPICSKLPCLYQLYSARPEPGLMRSIGCASELMQNQRRSCEDKLIGICSLENAKTNKRLAILYGSLPLRLMSSISGGAAMIGLSLLANALRAAESGSFNSLSTKTSASRW